MGKAWMWQLRTDSFWNFFTRSNKSRGTSGWGAYFDSGGGL